MVYNNNNKGNQNRNNNNNFHNNNNNNNFHNNNRNNNNNRGGRGGRSGGSKQHFGKGGGRGGGGGRSALTMCRNFTTTGNCPHGNKCHFAHGVRLHATVPAAQPKQQQQQNTTNYRNNHNNNNNNSNAVSSIEIWEQPGGGFKIFTASHDGFWRLWDTNQGQFTQVFEHNMHGPVYSCLVGGSYLVCGFESPPIPIGGTATGSAVPVGHAHVWNLQSPQQPPLELHMQTPLLNYAHNSGVTALILLPPDTVVTGAKDGSIRLWKFVTGKVEPVASLPGHARQVTALLDGGSGGESLWSAGMDHCIRIWDLATKTMRHCIATAHTHAVTGLLRYQAGADTFVLSCSLDQTVKVWNLATGECVASETCGGGGGTDHGNNNNNNGIVSMCLAQDTAQMDLLLLGMENGSIQCRSVVGGVANLSPLQSVFHLHHANTGVSHQGMAVQCLTAGPSATFYSGGGDGNMLVLSFTTSIQELLQQQQQQQQQQQGGGGQRH